MTRDVGYTEPLPPPRPPTVVAAAMLMLLAGGLVAAGTGVWSVVAPRDPSDHLIQRVLWAGLAMALAGVAMMRFFWDTPRSRRPWRHRAWAVLALLGAAYGVMLAIRGV